MNCLKRIVAAFPQAEVLVVDGGTDHTEQIVTAFCQIFSSVRYIRNFPDLGKGHAIRTGISQSSRNIICQLDADLQFHPEELTNLALPIITNEADMVLGSRFTKGSIRSPGSTPWFRFLGNHLMSLYASLLTRHRMTDVLAGVKAWRSEVTKSFPLKSNSYSYEVELPMKAIRNGWRVIDVPVSTEARLSGMSSVHAIRDGWNIFKDINKIWVFQTP